MGSLASQFGSAWFLQGRTSGYSIHKEVIQKSSGEPCSRHQGAYIGEMSTAASFEIRIRLQLGVQSLGFGWSRVWS